MIILQIKFANKGTTLVVNVVGELDHHSADHVRQKIDGELLKSTTKNVIFDFSKLSFMDSSGIGVIMGRYKNVNKLGGSMAIVSLNTQINRIIEMSGISKMIPVYESIENAVNKM
jgi:stage II sporulation protein AA (anti-sigma F factor antagonist)